MQVLDFLWKKWLAGKWYYSEMALAELSKFSQHCVIRRDLSDSQSSTDIAGLDFSEFPGSCPETRFLSEKYCTDGPEALLFSLIVFIRLSDDIIWIILIDLYPDLHSIPHISDTILFIQIGSLPSRLNTIFTLSYFSYWIHLGLSPWGVILKSVL